MRQPRVAAGLRDLRCQRLGQHQYKVERSISWLGSYRRLNVRWERKAASFLAMLGIACILICYKRLAKHADDF
ncbi:transposase [Nocardiopsis synnemataformans]|uniref:transposase n=1 Tax=Nocardiopsis synnemataformans TaxID=61305 RepID=UPI003EBE0700